MNQPHHAVNTDTAASTQAQARILAIVGMPGSGKSLLAEHLEAAGFVKIRFGGITIEEVRRRGLEVAPENEKLVREDIRANEGMDAYARRSLPKINAALETHNSIIIDGLYSFSEYKTLKAAFGDALVVVAITCDRDIRYARLGVRSERGLTEEQAAWRDHVEIETLEKGGPIAIADYTLLNNGTQDAVIDALHTLLNRLHLQP